MTNRLKPLADQTLVVTGATSGNGLAITEAAVRRGAAVVAVARNAAALAALQRRLSATGGRIATCVADVSDQAAVDRIEDVVIAAFGGFDSWINNAAVGTYGTLEQVPIDDHRRMFDVNYFGVLHGTLVALRHLRRRGGGAIITIGSVLGHRAIVEQGPYAATKHAVHALTETLRMEAERDGAGISVTLIKPGAIDTPFPDHAKNFMDSPPRLPQPLYAPELVADAVLFACVHPRRTLYVGGGGLLSLLMARAAPRIADGIMELVGQRAQQTADDGSDPRRRDNLRIPRTDALNGARPVHVRRSSLIVQAQKIPPPLVMIAAVAAGAALIARFHTGRAA